MKRFLRKKWVIAIALILAVLTVVLCCIFAVNASESRRASDLRSGSVRSFESKNGINSVGWLNNKLIEASHNRVRWLYELMSAAGLEVSVDKSDGTAILKLAESYGIIDSYTEKDMYMPLSRRYVGFTMTRALGYPDLDAGYIADISADESYMSAMAYLGYFLPDFNDRIYPGKKVTAAEFDALLKELELYRAFSGKSVLSFGDSIMYGTGNGGEGLSDMIAMKYGMTCADYAVPGATFGLSSGRGHIPDQIRKAYSQRVTADIILINGGTNDMNHTAFGNLSEGYDMSRAYEKDYTEAFERSLWMLRPYWRGTPVVYIRAHNMDLGEDSNERKYGERGLEIASKWNISSVDLYSNSGLNTEDPAMCGRYTYLNPSTGYTCDAIHPNAVGYAKFYLPPTVGAMEPLLREEEK